MATQVFRGCIEAGKICLDRRDQFAQLIASLDGKPIELILRREKSKRSNNQNSYYWGVVLAILGEHCGYSPQDMHEALKWKFLRQEGGIVPFARSTTDLSTAEFENYLEDCRMLAAECGVAIPGPNEMTP